MSPSIRRLAFSGRLLITAAAAVALYLAIMALSRTHLPGCEGTSSCQEALHSQWAYAFGIPVSFAGFVTYCAALLLSGAILRRERETGEIPGCIALLLIPCAAVWFTVIQALVLKEFCTWCCLTHALATSGSLLLWRARALSPPAANKLRGRFPFGITAGALAGTAVLGAGSFYGPAPLAPAPLISSLPPETDSTGPGAITAPAVQFPAIGTAKEGPTVWLLSDFTCPHCLELHAALENLARDPGGPAFRVSVLPVARDEKAAAIQRTMLTLWHVDPSLWSSAAAMISSGQVKPTPDAVSAMASSLTRPGLLASKLDSTGALIQRQMQDAATLREQQRSRPGGNLLPLLINGSRLMSGAETDASRLLHFILPEDAAAAAPARNILPRRDKVEPRLAILSPAPEFTALPPGKPVDFEIKLQNRGTGPLQINWLETAQGCFVTSLPDGFIRPGGTAVIGMKFQPPSTPGGTFERTIRIHSNAPGNPGEFLLTGSIASDGGGESTNPVPATASVRTTP